MGWKRQLLNCLNAVANPLQVKVLSCAEYADIRSMFLPTVGFGPSTPLSEREYLAPDNPRIHELRKRYRNHPAAAHSHWDEHKLLTNFVLHEFRRDSHYVWQGRWTKPETYLLTAYYLRER